MGKTTDKRDTKDTKESINDIVRDYRYLFTTGQQPNGERITFDAIATPNNTPVLRRVIETVVREGVEPTLLISKLFQTLRFDSGGADIIQFPTIGALVAEEIAEGMEYPERNPSWGGSTVTARIGKVGLAVRFTEEMLRRSQFDLMGLMLRKAGDALARKKETKCINMISALGTCTFDNVNPAQSIYGVLHGRDMQGNANGAMTLDDLMDAWVQVIMQGFNPNTLIMHPLAFTMFLKDPYLRAFALAAGGGVWFGGWRGQAQNKNPFGGHQQGTAGQGSGTNIIPGGNAAGSSPTPLGDYSNTLTSSPELPDRWPFPLKIVVSPLMPFNINRKLTNIIVCDSSVLGAIVQEEDPTTDEFDDPARDMRKVKIRERYAIVVVEEGQGISVMKNVHIVPNEIVLPPQSMVDVSGSNLAPISPTATVL